MLLLSLKMANLSPLLNHLQVNLQNSHQLQRLLKYQLPALENQVLKYSQAH